MSTQLIDFESGSPTTGDSGERSDTVAIKPISAGERVQAAVMDRPIENLRARTEELRGKVEELLYRADADKWIITGGNNSGEVTVPGAAAFPTVSWNSTTGLAVISQAIVVQPLMAPSTDLFGSLTYAFDGGTDTFVFESNDDALASDILYDYQLANSIRIIWETSTTFGAGVYCVATFEGTPEHILRIVIRSDGTTRASHVETELNTIMPPVVPAATLKFSLTGPGTTFIVLTDPGIVGREDVYMTNTYSRELHHITKAIFDNFFIGSPLSVDGDGIGIWYEEMTDSVLAQHGGRRQATPSTVDDGTGFPPNTEVPGTKLFKFSTEPEKIPGAIPLCRRIGTYLVFVDGTVVPNGQTTTFGSHGSLDALIAAYAAHVAGSADNHGADDITFDETNLIAWFVLAAGQADTVQEAIDQMVACLANADKGALLWPYAGNSFIGAEAVTDAPTSLVRGTVDSQTTALLTAVNARARIASPELITGNWQRNGSVATDYSQNIDLSTRLDLSAHGGAWGPGITLQDIGRKCPERNEAYHWGNPRTAANRFILSPTPLSYPISGQCILNIPMDAAETPYAGMAARWIFTLTSNASTPRVHITDPLTQSQTYLDLAAYLTAASWVGTDICTISNTSFAAMFTDGTNHCVQAWDVTHTFGVGFTIAVKAGWGTGVVLPGTGAGTPSRDRILMATSAAVEYLYTLNTWNDTTTFDCITQIRVSTGAIIDSGRGDATSAATRYPSGGFVTDGTNLYFTTHSLGLPASELCSATLADVDTGSGYTSFPLDLGSAAGDICTSLGYDGEMLFAPLRVFAAAGITMATYDLRRKTVGSIVDSTQYHLSDGHSYLGHCCYDGINLWFQEIRDMTPGTEHKLFLWCFDTSAVESGVTLQELRTLSPRQICVLDSTEVTGGFITPMLVGPLLHDGSSIFTVLEMDAGNSLCGQFRRVTRACHR